MVSLFWLILVSSLMLLIFALIAFMRFSLLVATIENVSMFPTFEHGDHVLVMRRMPIRWIGKGAIALISPKYLPQKGPPRTIPTSYIKRIIGLEGDTIVLSENRAVAVAQEEQHQAQASQPPQIWHISQGDIFVCGDNSSESQDSRVWGPIPMQSVLGIVLMKLPRRANIPPLSPPSFNGVQGKIQALVGQDAPLFVARTLHNETVTLATYRGCKVLFLFVVPSAHCRSIIPFYTSLATKATEAGITMVFVSGVSGKTTRTFVRELHIQLPVLVASRANNVFFRDYNVVGTPFYCLVDEYDKIQAIGYPDLNVSGGAWKMLVESWIGREYALPDGTS